MVKENEFHDKGPRNVLLCALLHRIERFSQSDIFYAIVMINLQEARWAALVSN